jgi:hypothetical protein
MNFQEQQLVFSRRDSYEATGRGRVAAFWQVDLPFVFLEILRRILSPRAVAAKDEKPRD